MLRPPVATPTTIPSKCVPLAPLEKVNLAVGPGSAMVLGSESVDHVVPGVVGEVRADRRNRTVRFVVPVSVAAWMEQAVKSTVALPVLSVEMRGDESVPFTSVGAPATSNWPSSDSPETGELLASRARTVMVDVDKPSSGSWSGEAETTTDRPSSDGPVSAGAACLSSEQAASAARPKKTISRFICT